jgi:hypothetical protein
MQYPNQQFRLYKAREIVVVTALVFLCQRLPDAAPARADSAQTPGTQRKESTYGPPATLGTIRNPAIKESSGLVASRTMPGVYWTHNDSGDGPFLYAIDSSGESRGVWRVIGATAIDWEDIAAGPGPQANQSYLYVGDIGDNNSVRSEIIVYRIPEPKSSDAKSTKARPLATEPAEAIRFRYPDGKHDAETLIVHPLSGDLYVVNKVAFANAVVYKASAPMSPNKTTTLARVVELKLPGLFGGIVTGGDISPDGQRVALCDYFGGYEAVLPTSSSSFDDIWKQRFLSIDLGKQKQRDGKALLTTSEGQSTLIEVVRR